MKDFNWTGSFSLRDIPEVLITFGGFERTRNMLRGYRNIKSFGALGLWGEKVT